MKSSLKKYVAAGVLAGVLGIGGAAVASAAAPDDSTDSVVPAVSSDDSSTTATTPATDDPNCPGMGEARAPAPGSTPTASDSSTADTSTE
jgi:hypothetical protein